MCPWLSCKAALRWPRGSSEGVCLLFPLLLLKLNFKAAKEVPRAARPVGAVSGCSKPSLDTEWCSRLPAATVPVRGRAGNPTSLFPPGPRASVPASIVSSLAACHPYLALSRGPCV